jgi:hypothetical protein
MDTDSRMATATAATAAKAKTKDALSPLSHAIYPYSASAILAASEAVETTMSLSSLSHPAAATALNSSLKRCIAAGIRSGS